MHSRIFKSLDRTNFSEQISGKSRALLMSPNGADRIEEGHGQTDVRKKNKKNSRVELENGGDQISTGV